MKNKIKPILNCLIFLMNSFNVKSCCVPYLLYKDESVCVCVCVNVRRPAAGPTQAITPKFGVGSSFHPGSAPSQGETPNVHPRGYPL